MKHILKPTFTLVVVAILLSALCLSAFSAEYITAGTKGDTPASDSYAESKYYAHLSHVTLTGDNAKDVVAIALSQLGYRESDSEEDLSGLSEGGSLNFAEYNRNFGDYGSGLSYNWCASFVSFCLLQAGCHEMTNLSDWCRDHMGDPDYIWREVSCEKWKSALNELEYFKSSASYSSSEYEDLEAAYDPEYIPTPGDLIFFSEKLTNEASHIGIVIQIAGEKIYTVEGNTDKESSLETDGDGVYIKSYNLTDKYIIGYGDMPYQTRSDVPTIDHFPTDISSGSYISTADISVYGSLQDLVLGKDPKYTLPQYCMFNVTQINDNGFISVKYIVDGKTVSGYASTSDVIQISDQLFETPGPVSSPKASASWEAYAHVSPYILMALALCGVFLCISAKHRKA